VATENLFRLALTSVRRFPNPIPPGTRLPRWTLVDFKCYQLSSWDPEIAMTNGGRSEFRPGTIFDPEGISFSSSTPINTATPRFDASIYSQPTGITGKPSSAVSCDNTTLPFPAPEPTEYSEGVPKPGPTEPNKGASVPGPTKSNDGRVGRHSPNVGAITGGTVGGIAMISTVVVALFFYRRRRRHGSLAPLGSSTSDSQSGAYSDPHVDQVPPRSLLG